MPPVLTLFLCSIFVLVLLRLDSKLAPDLARSLWVPTIWMLYISSKPLAVWFPSSGATPESSPIDRSFLILLICLAVWALFKRASYLRTRIRENVWVIALGVFMLLSVLWSDMPATSFVRWIREAQAILMAFIVLSMHSPRRAVEAILRRTIYILIPFSLLLIKYFPTYGREYTRWSGEAQWIGVTQQKNGLGRLCLIAVFFLIWSFYRRRLGHYPPVRKVQSFAEFVVLAMAIWMLRGSGGHSYSATALAALALGLLIFWGLTIMNKRAATPKLYTFIVTTSAIILLGTISLFSNAYTIGSVAPAIGRDSTLTDRTGVWKALLPVALQHPIVGRGVGGFWTPDSREAYNISEAHSGYLDLILEYGFIGIILFSLFYISYCRKAYRELFKDFEWGALAICLLMMFLVHNITESSMHTFTSQLTAVVLFMSVTLAEPNPKLQASS